MKCFAALVMLFTLSLTSQVSATDEKAFYRLNIVNEQGQLLVVQIKGQGVWVTTGLYASPKNFNPEQFHKMANSYGLNITDISLHGDFQVSPAKDKPFQTRYFYQAIAQNEVQTTPDFIEQIKWLAPEEAFALITFPHISYLTRQTIKHPQQVWSAKIQRYTDNGNHKIRVLEGFHIKPGASAAAGHP